MTERILKAIRRRISLMVGRFLLAAIDDSGLDRQGLASPQRLKGTIFKGERQLEDVAHLQPYGLHSHPHPGSEGIALQVGGSRSHLVALAVDDPRHSPKDLAEGEVAIYDDQRVFILLKRGDELEVRGASYDGLHGDVFIITNPGSFVVSAFDKVQLLANDDIEIRAFGGSAQILLENQFGGGIVINAGASGVAINGDVVVTGDIEYTGTLKQTAANVDLTAHVHDSNDHGDTLGPK